MDNLEKIVVSIEYINYSNPDNGFVIFKAKDFETKDPVSVKGYSFELTEGDVVEINGKWINDPKFGRQFSSDEISVYTPATGEKIKTYLQSGYIKGIGVKTADNIFEMFGEDSIKILDQNPNELNKVKGIGKKTLEKIIKDWNIKRVTHKQNEELKELGFSFNEALKITKVLGGEAMEVVCKNPYSLVREQDLDFSFSKIDRIALKKLKFSKNDVVRVLTYFLYELKANEKSGSTFIEKNIFLNQAKRSLGLNISDLEIPYLAGIQSKKIIELKKDGVYILQTYFTYITELEIAKNLKKLMNNKSLKIKNPSSKIDDVTEDVKLPNGEEFKLSKGQYNAVLHSVQNKVNIINGGPGVGKTTALKILIEVLNDEGLTFTLCAPTGMAAQRMSESTNEPAGTIHKTLEYNPQLRDFQKNEENPIETDYVIIDETSMVDVFLFCKILKAISPLSTLIIIGDINQIASVAAGCVLRDLIESELIPVSSITEIQRQAKGSLIIKNAYLVNQGKFIEYKNKKTDDFFFLKTNSDSESLTKIRDMITTNIPKAFNVKSKDSVQLLSATHEKILGRKNLNKELQAILNGEDDIFIKRGDVNFKQNDNVMQTKNNSEKEIFNGDTGVIQAIVSKSLHVDFNGKMKSYDYSDLDELELSYSITMHKSQGSEYPIVIIPISHDYSRMIDRSLLYTAITRGKAVVILVGSEKRLRDIIKNDYSRNRKTHLKEKIKEVFKNED